MDLLGWILFILIVQNAKMPLVIFFLGSEKGPHLPIGNVEVVSFF
jgi:hypothetical protein